jgi:hypothetical protein
MAPTTITDSEISGRGQLLCIPRYIRCVPHRESTRDATHGRAARALTLRRPFLAHPAFTERRSPFIPE